MKNLMYSLYCLVTIGIFVYIVDIHTNGLDINKKKYYNFA